MRNGDVKIKGKNIIVDADDSLRLESKKILLSKEVIVYFWIHQP